MNTKEFTYLLQHPDKLRKEQAGALEKLIKEFPYFQSVRALALKSLKDQESFRYNQELKTTAAYTADRGVLFDFITSELFKKQKEEGKSKADIEVVDAQEIRTLPRIDMGDAIRMKIEEAEDVLDPKLFAARKEESIIKQTEIAASADAQTKEHQDTDKTPSAQLEIDKPLDFDKKETHSFAEWLKLTSLKPVDREIDQQTEKASPKPEEKEPKTSLDQKDKFELIDEFITTNPKITPASKNTTTRNLAKESITPSEELMTETLARVYLAQKNYKKAIQAYKILILKNPEKSGFFADQIRAIKNLQENK